MMPAFESVPEVLCTRPQWLVWRKEPTANGFTKKPYDAKQPSRLAQSNNSETWSDFDTATGIAEQGKASGIGYVFAKGDGLVGIDLDHVIDPQTGELSEMAEEIVDRFKGRSYIEHSPSGDGLHIWCKGKPLRTGKGTEQKQVEVYDHTSPRYFTVTGKRFCEGNIEDCQDALDWLYARYFAPRETSKQAQQNNFSRSNTDDDERLRDALKHVSAEDYADWVTVGMALKADGRPFEVWDWWSRSSAKYDPKGMDSKWESFHVSGLSLGTVFYLAQRGGWQPKRTSEPRLSPIAQDDWQEPEPIINALLPVESLLPELVPEPLRAYVFDEAERMSCPPDNTFSPLLVALGAVIGTGCGIKPKAHDSWLVVPNIWGAIIAPPGRKKTAALKAGTRFLDELEESAEEKFNEAERQFKADYAEFKATEDRIKNDMKTATRPGKSRYAGQGLRGTQES